MLILEGYGLTETNSLTTINRADKYKFGTVGRCCIQTFFSRLPAMARF
jgi:long-subunit acyl-CoA synthetase (AMP-forming)